MITAAFHHIVALDVEFVAGDGDSDLSVAACLEDVAGILVHLQLDFRIGRSVEAQVYADIGSAAAGTLLRSVPCLDDGVDHADRAFIVDEGQKRLFAGCGGSQRDMDRGIACGRQVEVQADLVDRARDADGAVGKGASVEAFVVFAARIERHHVVEADVQVQSDVFEMVVGNAAGQPALMAETVQEQDIVEGDAVFVYGERTVGDVIHLGEVQLELEAVETGIVAADGQLVQRSAGLDMSGNRSVHLGSQPGNQWFDNADGQRIEVDVKFDVFIGRTQCCMGNDRVPVSHCVVDEEDELLFRIVPMAL